ncbi:MAG: LLM class flavin-dependent oxidoreductase [Promethearchaeota archaeon]
MSEIKFGNQLFFSHSYDFLRKKVTTANKENWDSIWFPDHLTGMPGVLIDDFLSLWPVFGSFAELAKGKLFGSAVTDPHRIHPAVLAQIATTINHISGGKFILGIGAGEAMNLRTYNINYDHALTKMRETIELIKLFWRKGKRVTYKGKFYETKKALLLPQPISEIPIWVAANGPKTLQMTAEIADGWLPTGITIDFYKSAREKIVNVLNEKGRDISKFTFGAFYFLFMNDDEEQINEVVKRLKYSLLLQPRAIKEIGFWKDEFDDIFFEATGFGCEEISPLKVDRDDLLKFDLKKLEPILDNIPDKVIRENGIIGTKEEILKKIKNYIETGAQHFVFTIDNGASSKNAPFTYWDVCKIISEEIIPLFK